MKESCNCSLISSEASLLHSSLWAQTFRDKESVYKVFRFDDIQKINKEYQLLKLMDQISCELLKDPVTESYVLKTRYLNTENISSDLSVNFLVDKLHCYFKHWESSSFSALCIPGSWGNAVSYYTYCINTYAPEYSESVNVLLQQKAEHFVHGDLTPDNVKIYDEDLVVFDFENAMQGPLMWDETTFVYGLLEAKLNTVAEEVFRRFDSDTELLFCIAVIKLAIARKKECKISDRENILLQISEWRM